MFADAVDAAEEDSGGFLIQDKRQWWADVGLGGGCIKALIALVEFATGEDGLVQHGKEARTYGLFEYAFLNRR
jgi:hypothetical protein